MSEPTTGTETGAILSARESALLELAGRGLIDKEIAVEMGVSLSTIRTYWDRVRVKLGALNRAHAVSLGMPQNRLDKIGEEVSSFILRHLEQEAIFVCGADRKALSWNRGVEALLGYSEAEWLGIDASVFFLPGEEADADQEIRDAAAAGASVNYRWHERKDGSRFWGSNTVIQLETPGRFAKIIRELPARAVARGG